MVTISSTTAHVTLSGVTITNGSWLREGAGITNNGVLTLLRSTVSGNRTALSVCPVPSGCMLKGGGIFNAAGASLTLGNSTVWNNSVSISGCSVLTCGTQGGGIYNGGTLVVYNSTISGNHAGPNGTGVGIYSAGTATIRSSTLAGNSGVVRGIYGRANVENTILANAGTNGVNCGGTVTSNGYNLSNDTSCHFFTSAGDLNNIDPVLGPLQYNGGQTQTMALPSGSPAVDAGNPTGCTDGLGHVLKADQRGQPRPDVEEVSGCDLGSYEYQALAGHCVIVCGTVGPCRLTGYCAGPVNNSCQRGYDPVHCLGGQSSLGSGFSCGQSIDPERYCKTQ